MKDIKGSQTEINVLTAFAGESQARNRYTFYARQAEKDGFIFVRNVFTETANQECAHAKRLFGFLQGGTAKITGEFPAGVIADTYHNLIESAAGEHEEYDIMYPQFADVAEKEGFIEIATTMRNIATAEAFHEKRFLELADMIKKQTMFHDDNVVVWRCLNCGELITAKDAPKACPVCLHPTAYFERLNFSFV